TAQSAVAIENLQLVEDMQRRLLEMADLTWVSTRVTSTLDAEKIVATIADAASKALDVPRVALFVARSDGRYAPIPGGQLGLPEENEDLLADRDHLGAEAVLTSAPQTVADARQEGLEDDPLVRWLGTRSLLCVPMTARQGLRGLLAVGDERPRTFRAHEVALLSAYANQTALALQSALLYQDVVRHLNHLSSLFEVSQTLASSLELSKTLDRVLDSASELLGAPLCSLMLTDPDTGDLVIKAARGLNTDEALYATLKPGEGLAGRAAQSGTSLVSADATRDGRFKHRARARELSLRAAMAAPLIAHDRTVGVLNLYRQSSHKFTEDDRKLVMLLANSAAVAIDNARLYQEAQERGQFLAAMMGEINHRMRNTLQAVAGLLRMDLDHPGPRSTEDALRRGIARLQSVAVVHELMPAQELQFVDIKRAASRIAHLTCQAVAPDRKIQTRVSGARVMLPSQRATSVAMILSELIDNALRHGLRQRDDGLITISFAEGGGNIVVQVRDNGVGLPEDFDPETVSGLGLKVVRGLVEKELGGTLDLEMKRGLIVRARFPKHH
ncbi:MAG: GAF domain-containing protein, partial [Armatimonadota bacterium]|nr:GAF domain-containing protein [Armatimonadota bacterium]